MRIEDAVVILDHPLYSINLGYVARVMANLGFPRLRLVQPRAAIDEWSVSMSMEGRPILESAVAYDRFEEAIADCDLTLATTRRVGRRKVAVVTPRTAAWAVAGLPDGMRVGIVFGSEDKGLSNEQVEACSLTVHIPGAAPHDSFNLSHAAAIVLYEIRYTVHNLRERERSRARDIEGLLEHARRVLVETGFLAADDPRRALAKLRAMLYRARMTERERGLLHAIFDHMARLAAVKDRVSRGSAAPGRQLDPGRGTS